MATVDANLRTFLGKQAAIARICGNRVGVDVVPESPLGPYIWFGLSTTRHEQCLDDAVGTVPFGYQYDLECIAQSRRQARDLATAVNAALNLYAGTFGEATVQRAFVDEQNSDYQPRNDFSDLGFFTIGLAVEIVP